MVSMVNSKDQRVMCRFEVGVKVIQLMYSENISVFQRARLMRIINDSSTRSVWMSRILEEIDHRLSPPGGSYQHKRALASLSRLGGRKYNFYVTILERT